MSDRNRYFLLEQVFCYKKFLAITFFLDEKKKF